VNVAPDLLFNKTSDNSSTNGDNYNFDSNKDEQVLVLRILKGSMTVKI
jgi:hypothetical protein